MLSYLQANVKPYFDKHKPFFAADKAEVLQAHADFFRAVSEGDMSLMKALWLDSRDAICVQVGWHSVYVCNFFFFFYCQCNPANFDDSVVIVLLRLVTALSLIIIVLLMTELLLSC
jgi:hypothetical protein